MGASCIWPDACSIIGPRDPRHRSESRHVTSRAAIGGKPSGLAPPPKSRNPDSAGAVRIRETTPTSISPYVLRAKRNPFSTPFSSNFCTEPSPVTPCFPFPAVQKSPDSLSGCARSAQKVLSASPSLNSHDIRRRRTASLSTLLTATATGVCLGAGKRPIAGPTGRLLAESCDVQTNNPLSFPLHHLGVSWPRREGRRGNQARCFCCSFDTPRSSCWKP